VDAPLSMDPGLCAGFATHKRGNKVICVHVSRAIHGMLIASLTFYKKFKADLEQEGFIFDNCDPCVANKMTNGKQFMTRFHVDDVANSHVDPKQNDKFEKWLNDKCGQHSEVATT